MRRLRPRVPLQRIVQRASASPSYGTEQCSSRNASAEPTAHHADVVVVGAGMVGAAVAAAIGDRMRVALVDKFFPAPLPPSSSVSTKDNLPICDMRVAALSPASIKFLDEIGVWPIMRQHRTAAFSRMAVWENDASNPLLFTPPEDQDDLGHVVENSITTRALCDAARGRAGVTCIKAGLRELQRNEDGAEVLLDDGTRVKAALVIGADGANSRCRAAANISAPGWSYSQKGVVATLEVELNSTSNDTAYQRFRTTGPIALLPVGGNQVSLVWSTTLDEAEHLLSLNDVSFVTSLNTAVDGKGAVPFVKRVLSKRAAFPLRCANASSYVANRLALVGDAAHVVHPLAGQGVNLGFGDAVELTKILREAQEAGLDYADHHLLGQYSRRRKIAVTGMMAVVDGLHRLFSSSLSPISHIRRFGMDMLNLPFASPLKRVLGDAASNSSPPFPM